jgi:Transposase DDE domain group 1
VPDSISDMDLLRHGGMGRVFEAVRAPSTLGTFVRAFTFGHVRQLDAVAARLLACLAHATPLLRDADQVVLVDVDDTVRQTYGYAKQGAGRGYTGVKGLNGLLAVLSTPTSAPVIAAARLRTGATNSARGAGKLLADALATARRAGAGSARNALVLVRADSAYYGYDIINTCRRAGARFSVTARLTPSVVRTITSIDEAGWTAIRIPQRDLRRGRAALGLRRRGRRSGVHRVHRAHNREPILHAEATHRDHAIIEQVIAELKNGPLAHLPSGRFTANPARLVCAAIAPDLTRAAGVLAGGAHTRARPRPCAPA